MLKMFKKYPELLSFGVLMAAFSSPGQTFLISLFIPFMRESLEINTHTMTALYSFSTLLSGFFLPWTGRVFDRVPLLPFSLSAIFLLSLGCLLLGAATGPISVCLGFFIVRNLGQGTLTLVSTTCMAQLFGSRRGRAIGVANLGYPLGEIIFPMLLLFCIHQWGWRSGWFFLSGFTLFFLFPTIWLLLRHDPHKKIQDKIAIKAETEHTQIAPLSEWKIRQIMRDYRFYLILFPSLIPPAFFTALFFHQIDLFRLKNWDVSLIGVGFVLFGILRAITCFVTGSLVDRYTARHIFPFTLLPLAAGLFCFLFGLSWGWSLLYFGFSGMATGFSGTASAALYAEIYGTHQLGALRGITSAAMIFVTAIIPLILAVLLESFNLPVILGGMLFCVLVGFLSALYLRLKTKHVSFS